MTKCKVCQSEFEKVYTTLQKTCSIACAIEWAAIEKAEKAKKAFRQETRRLREKIKPRSKWLQEAQAACNAYIRARDKNEPCISCGTCDPNIQYCAGHYKTRGGHPELRFHPMNIHKQCNKNCNLHLSGNIAAYRPRLIEKIGLENVKWLEGEHQAQNWTIDDLREIKAYYKEQLKAL